MKRKSRSITRAERFHFLILINYLHHEITHRHDVCTNVFSNLRYFGAIKFRWIIRDNKVIGLKIGEIEYAKSCSVCRLFIYQHMWMTGKIDRNARTDFRFGADASSGASALTIKRSVRNFICLRKIYIYFLEYTFSIQWCRKYRSFGKILLTKILAIKGII